MTAAPWEALSTSEGPLSPWISTFCASHPVNESSPAVEVELLRRMAEGDTAALGEFYDRHSQTLFGLTCRILSDAKEAEDVLQEVFLLLWEKASTYDPRQGRPLSWALTLARNKAIDRLRATHRRRARLIEETEAEPVQDYPAASLSPPETLRVGEEGELVRAALRSLPADQRCAIELAFFDGLSQTEVATALNQPLGTIKARIRRGMLKLRSELQDHL